VSNFVFLLSVINNLIELQGKYNLTLTKIDVLLLEILFFLMYYSYSLI